MKALAANSCLIGNKQLAAVEDSLDRKQLSNREQTAGKDRHGQQTAIEPLAANSW